MDNQHRAIKGYRELNESEVAAMNEVKMKGAELGELVEKLRADSNLDQRWVSIGATELQQGLMALTRAIAKPTFFVLALMMAGCSSGLQEVAFMDQGRYIVSRSLVNARVTAGQPHVQGVFVCRQKISSEDLSKLRKDGNEHSQYLDCTPATEYVQASDQPIATLYKGPLEAAILGGSVGAGLALSGDTVVQQGLSQRQTQTQKQKASARAKGRH